MGDISENFNRAEFACPCGCGFNAVDKEIIDILENVRIRFNNSPIHITSACRCITHNYKKGSLITSQHPRGMAVDFHINGVNPEAIGDYIRNNLLMDHGGIGIYPHWAHPGIHIDVRNTIANWEG